ncbi:MAG: hypothetical protein ACI8VE_001063 [Natrialbaceae archaeon]|jgi:hypothetical protein
MARNEASLTSVMGWMALISVLLFWLPLGNGLIAGYVGGKKAGSAGRGAKATLLPGLIVTIVAFVGFSLLGPIAGLVNPAAIGGGVAIVLLILYLIYTFPLLGGAVIGGALAD